MNKQSKTMNEKIDLTKILKDCPKGTKFYSTIYGEVEFYQIKEESDYPINFVATGDCMFDTTSDGKYYKNWGECTLFPSEDQRDWSKFTAPWYKKERFDPKTLQPFERVLARITKDGVWHATFFSHYDKEVRWGCYPFVTTSSKSYSMCIPYNDDTKHLRGTTDEAPKFYRYWED